MSSAAKAYQAYQDTTFFASLDGLRCFCIALVLWHHTPSAGSPEISLRLLQRGFTGVDFFFVLSGFLITTLLLREEARTGRISLRGFYRRRILRIVPVYFLVVTIASVWFVGVRGYDLAGAVPYYYLFFSNYLNDHLPLLAPTWSLSVEEQYYLVWPLMLVLLPAAMSIRVAVVIVIVVLALLTTTGALDFGVYPTEYATFRLPLGAFSTILTGSLLAMALHSPKGFAVVWHAVGARGAPVVWSAALIALWQFLPVTLAGWPNLLMHSAMAAVLASLVVRADHVAAPLLTWRPIARLGVISYGLYLWHLFGRHVGVEGVQLLGLQGLTGWALTLVVYVAASVAIAELSFRYFESWFLKLKSPKRPSQTP